MKNQWKCRRRIAAAIVLALAQPGVAVVPAKAVSGGSDFVVSGWPTMAIDDGLSPRLGNDPLLGRLACPPLVRLNLKSGANEPLLLKEVVSATGPEAATWTFKMKPVSWWDGSKATSADMAAFLKRAIPVAVTDKGGGTWEVPEFTVEPLGADSVRVSWPRPPAFGPYVLGGIPFSQPVHAEKRASKAEGSPPFECAGLYRFRREAKSASIILEPSAGYSVPRRRIVVPTTSLDASVPQREGIRFSYHNADTTTGDPATCPYSGDLPLVSAVVWNMGRPNLSKPEVRRAFTGVMPRGILARGGLVTSADLVSGPLLRSHAGYNAAVPVIPFELEQSLAILEKQGYKLHPGDIMRSGGKDSGGVVLKLVLATEHESILEKFVTDSFAAAGIQIEIVRDRSKAGESDGMIAGLSLPWPDLNYIGEYHSSSENGEVQLGNIGSDILDKELEKYALSLTQKVPDFATLKRVHALLAEHEPMSVLAQHRACLSFFGSAASRRREFDLRDNDWFRQVLGM